MNYKHYQSIPDREVLDSIVQLHERIFGDSNRLIQQMKHKPKPLVHVAMDGTRVIGYKIGYALNSETFYSWLGGVDPNHRNHGVGSQLIGRQHRWLKEKGYRRVRTKTKNQWRDMLILNLKNGFDIIGTYTDKKGEPKIILEKKLF